MLALMGQNSWAQIRDFQTTRLMSTAGTGVASVLATESAILNPASSAFFSGSAFAYQGYTTTLKKESDLRDTAPDKFPNNNNAQGIFVADNSGPVKGGASYLTQSENHYERERMILHGAAPMGDSAAMGISYNYIQDEKPRGSSPRHQVLHQVNVGIMQVIDEKTTLGLVWRDATRTNPGDERVTGGFQYSVADRIMLMGDFGYQYTGAISRDYIWSAAVQLNVFSDFFLRVGQFYDNINFFKGTGWGISWIGPRLGVEFAQKYSDQFSEGYVYQDEQLVDTSLSVLIKF